MTKESLKKIAVLALGAMTYVTASAVPASPIPVKMTQPDGSTITVRLNGDEFVHWSSTTDGYSIVKNTEGYYVYAQLKDGDLVATEMRAQDVEHRDPAQKAFLAATPKYLAPTITPQAEQSRASFRSMQQGAQLKASTRNYDYNNFRGLVLLVEFNDRSFSRDDYAQIATDMVCAENYDGYMSNAAIPQKVTYTGSVRDYFYDNSFGVFDPKFDIVGPIKIDYSQYYPEGASYATPLIRAAVNAAEEEGVDFSLYDGDEDGSVDMIYFIFAGAGSNFGGNDERLIWPHASSYYAYVDGVRTGRYACSTELYGYPSQNMLDGIGTICHEFSHCLGLMDEYDTDYSGSGGQSITPDGWSVMSGGSYNNYGRTPVGYSLFQRYQAGFATPTLITSAGKYTLKDIDEVNEGYRINSGKNKEFFLLENRRKGKWNAYSPGEGMLVFRVDSTSTLPWSRNTINANPKHNYYELLRAKPQKSGTTVKDSDGDPFPGSGNVTVLNNYTTPHLKSWTGVETEVTIDSIAESADGIITFNAVVDNEEKDVEDFEKMTATNATGTYTELEGEMCAWDLEKGGIYASSTGIGNGKKVLALKKRGTATTTVVEKPVKEIRISAFNVTSSRATIKCHYSLDRGETWTESPIDTAETIAQLAGNTNSVLKFYPNLTELAMFRLELYTGNSLNPTYFDDIQFIYNDESAVESNFADAPEVKVYREGDFIVAVGVGQTSLVTAYSTSGAAVAQARAIDGVVRLYVPLPGVYVVSDGTTNVKILR